ncbi:hypothetical protein Tco_0788624 [Tanacetum coccineum]
MDDEPIWAADHVVALTPGSAITIPETANEFAIKGNHLTLVKGNQFDGRTKTDSHKHIHEFLRICDMFKYRDTENEAVRLMMFPLSLTGEAKTWLDELNEGTIETKCSETVMVIIRPKAILSRSFIMLLKDKVLLKLDWAKNQKTKSSLKKTVAFADEGSSNSDTDKIMARMDAMTIKMDAQYKELQSRAKKTTPTLTMMTYLCPVKKRLNSCKLSDMQIPFITGRPFLHTADVVIRVKQKQLNLGVGTERMIFNIDSAMKHSYSNDDTCFSINVIDEILEEDFDALLDEGSKILHSIEGTLLEEEIFSEFDEFMAMTADENSESESDTRRTTIRENHHQHRL